jgi:hypothetical protein
VPKTILGAVCVKRVYMHHGLDSIAPRRIISSSWRLYETRRRAG